MNSGAYLLDTHAWLWLVDGDRRLSTRARAAIDTAAAQGSLYVSALSVWEVAMLDAGNRITLTLECRAWIRAALGAPGLSLMPLSPEIAIESTRLPDYPHRDPVDRILIATARITGSVLVTNDRRIQEYAQNHHLRVLAT